MRKAFPLTAALLVAAAAWFSLEIRAGAPVGGAAAQDIAGPPADATVPLSAEAAEANPAVASPAESTPEVETVTAAIRAATAPEGAAGEEAAPEETIEGGMTLADLLEAGGWVMYVIYFLSFAALAMIFYFTLTLTESKLLPGELVTRIRHLMRDKKHDEIIRLCRNTPGMFSKVVLAGVVRGIADPREAAFAMEMAGRREAEAIMRRVRVLADIATISPMVGLLGTVLGMINAFNLIAFDLGMVKPVAMAGAVAQALVTTAAGLIVAIPSMGFFFFFRAKLHTAVGRVEEEAALIAEHIAGRVPIEPEEPDEDNQTAHT